MTRRVRRLDGSTVSLRWVRHHRTLTHRVGLKPRIELEVFRLPDGREILAETVGNTAREVPQNVRFFDYA